MTEKLNLFNKLLAIRKSVEYIQKTEKGNQGAMHVDPAVLLKTIRDKMDEHGVLLVPALTEAEAELISAPTKNNKDAKTFVFKSSMSYTWYDCDSDMKLPVPWVCTGKHMTDPAMAQGSALTYSERYFLLKFFQIPTAKDDPEFFEAKTGEKITEKQIIQLEEIIESKGYNVAPVLAKYSNSIAKVGKIENLPASRFEEAKTFFGDMKDAPKKS